MSSSASRCQRTRMRTLSEGGDGCIAHAAENLQVSVMRKEEEGAEWSAKESLEAIEKRDATLTYVQISRLGFTEDKDLKLLSHLA